MFWDFLRSLFGTKKPVAPNNTPPQPAPADPTPEPAAIVSPRVLSFIYDPIVDAITHQKLSQAVNWHRPADLSSQYISTMLEASNGLARYQIVQQIEVNEFPIKADGYRYTSQAYHDVIYRVAQPHEPDLVNYQDFLTRYNILQRVAANEIDEVWIFGFPYAGFYESTMGGPGAFFCNSDPIPNTSQCPRRFIIMGFSAERGVGEMLESFGHRTEFIMDKVFSRVSPQNNLWQKFIRYDKAFPGQAEVGNIHFAPNSDKDYDWGNQRMVSSHCDDWYNFPNFKGTVKQVNCAEWGGGEIYAHHKWWLKHLPRVGGRINGIANNWWQYTLDPNRVAV